MLETLTTIVDERLKIILDQQTAQIQLLKETNQLLREIKDKS